MTQRYNDPAGGTQSTVGNQMNLFHYQKKALIEARKKQVFMQLASVENMPKNMGKKIKRYHYLPMLDDANLNDQGIDAAGVAINPAQYTVTLAGPVQTYAVEADATAAAAAINAISSGTAVKSGSSTPWTVTSNKTVLGPTTAALSTTVLSAVPHSIRTQGSGNLYGSSKDIGTISGKLPALSETGGRVNRVGFKRKEIEGTFEKFGFFDEYTQESIDFDSDAELQMHIHREMMNGASEITEDALMIDLVTSAGVVKFAGGATTDREIDGDSLVNYGDLMRMNIDLDQNRTPRHTTMITGTRLTDTRVIPNARVAYIGSELLPTFMGMKDLHNQPAWIAVEKYAAGGTTLLNERGAVDACRIVVVEEMVKWAGAGARVGNDTSCYDNGLHYDVFPILFIGEESFTTIGFQTDGKTVKFKIIHKAPSAETADRTDPYGETGFMSIKWYYGFMALRPERLGLIKTAAKL